MNGKFGGWARVCRPGSIHDGKIVQLVRVHNSVQFDVGGVLLPPEAPSYGGRWVVDPPLHGTPLLDESGRPTGRVTVLYSYPDRFLRPLQWDRTLRDETADSAS